jgi:hypothetical protein
MVRYAVTLKDAEWTVFKDGEPLTRGMSRSEAIAHAENLAFQAEDDGEDVELLVQDYTGELRARYSGGGEAPARARRSSPGT